MIVASLLSMALLAGQARDCTTYWIVRLTYEAAPGVWSSTGVGPMTQERQEAADRRDEILARGWVWPRLLPGEPDPELRGETRVAPGAIRYCSVKRLCCTDPGPGQHCTYPDGDPPPAP